MDALGWSVLLYLASLALLAVFTFFPVRGPKEPDKAFVVVLALPPLAVIGAWRCAEMTGGAPVGLLCGAALNLSIVVGTGFDPLRAVVNWNEDDDGRAASESTGAAEGSSAAAPDVRPRKVWPVLLTFGVLATLVITVVAPRLPAAS